MKKILICILLLPLFIIAEIDFDDDNRAVTLPPTIPAALQTPPTPPQPTPPAEHPAHKTVWTKPLIIDNNNHDFDGTSILKLHENIVYKPPLNYVYPPLYVNMPAAIIIAKDNITIDLSGFNLSLDPSSASNFLVNMPTYGIAVYQGVKNLKIISTSLTSQSNRQGSISGFSGFAIYMIGSNQSYNNADIFSQMIKNVWIDNILVTQNISGIYINNALQVKITNSNIIYNYSPRLSYGIYFAGVFDGLIHNCVVNQNTSYGDIYGICLQDTIAVTVEGCQTNLNRSLKNGNAIGLNVTATSNVSSYANIINNCISNANLCAFINDKESIGFLLSNGTKHNTLQNCVTFYSSHGPSFANAPIPIDYPHGIGIKLENAPSNQIDKNKSGHHDNYGFYDNAIASSSFYTNNTAYFNPTANYSVSIPTGTGVEPLPSILIYQDALETYDYRTPLFANLEIKSR